MKSDAITIHGEAVARYVVNPTKSNEQAMLAAGAALTASILGPPKMTTTPQERDKAAFRLKDAVCGGTCSKEVLRLAWEAYDLAARYHAELEKVVNGGSSL